MIPQRVLCTGRFVNLTQFTGPSQHGSPFITLTSFLCLYCIFLNRSHVIRELHTKIQQPPYLVWPLQCTFVFVDGWGWRGTRSVMAICIRIAQSSWQNGPEKFKIPSIKKIVWLLHALSLTDQLIISSLLSLSLFLSLSPPPAFFVFVGCCHFPGALQIENSEETDQGKYECVASNVEGVRYSSPANLYVRGREQSGPRARPKIKNKNIHPFWLKCLHSAAQL